MESGILASLMITADGSAAKIGTVRKQATDDSFSSIFSEKLQERREPGSARFSSEPGGGFRVRKGMNSGRSAPNPVRSENSSRVSKPEDGMAMDETERNNEPEANGLAEEIAALMENLFTGLDPVLLYLDGSGEVSDGAVQGNSAAAYTMLQELLGGALERLREILNQVNSVTGEKLPENIRSMTEQVEALMTRVMELCTERENSMPGEFEMVAVADGETFEELVSQLRDQCRTIADSIRSGQAYAKGSDSLSDDWAVISNAADAALDEIVQSRGKDDQEVDSRNRRAGSDSSANDSSKGSIKAGAENGRTATGTDSTEMNANPYHVQQAPETVQARDATPTQKAASFSYHLSDKQLNENVTSQVTAKIKLMAAENRQEIEMQLKPDSLGRLTLRLIHERGQVLAKITAENEQVKSILESNMQLLRDALEKNGYSVQSLDVSVGEQGNGSLAQRHEQGRREPMAEPAANAVSADFRKLPERLYGLDIPGISQQIDLIA